MAPKILMSAAFVIGLASCSQATPPAGIAPGHARPEVSQKGDGSSIVEFVLPTTNAGPLGIDRGSDGNVWLTEQTADRLARITTSGAITEFAVSPGSSPSFIAAGPDGKLWFSEPGSNHIGKTTTTGALTEFSIPNAAADPRGITSGPDGNVWFTEYGASAVARITPQGTVTEFKTPTAGSRPAFVAAGPDGNIWFTEAGAGRIGRFTIADSSIAEFPIPSGGVPTSIVSRSGMLYFGEIGTGNLGRITPSGTITEYHDSSSANLFYLSPGPGGGVWLAGDAGLQAFSVAANSFTQIMTPLASPQVPLLYDSDGQMWFAEPSANKVGVYLSYIQQATPNSISFVAIGQTQTFSVSETNYHGTFYVSSSNPAVATVSPASGATTFTVTAVGGGTSTITVSDSPYGYKANTTPVSISVTTTSFTIR